MIGNLVMLPRDVALEALDGRRIAAWLGTDEASAFDLEDAVVAVHHLLTGAAFASDEGALAFLARGGRVFDASEVAHIADAIESLSAKVVHARLASDVLAASPPFSGRALSDDDKEWLLAVLQGVMVFMRRAASEGAPVLVVLRADG